jgi:hypothetical protein
MTTYTTAINSTDEAIKIFQRLGVDEQLAWLWYTYKQMGHFVTPAAPGAAASEIAQGLYRQVADLAHHEQLAVMRAIARNEPSNQIAREYGALSDNTRLAFWLYLARGMDEGTIIPTPNDYALSPDGRDLLAAVETMAFESQITLLRGAVQAMGAQPLSGAAI